MCSKMESHDMNEIVRDTKNVISKILLQKTRDDFRTTRTTEKFPNKNSLASIQSF